MSGETKTIILKRPLQGHTGPISRIVLREPTFDEYLTHGDPYTIAASRGGTPFMVENSEVIKTYIQVCLVEPKDPALLEQGKARLAREVKEAVLSFFRPDDEKDEASATSQTSSPSEASGATPSQTSKG